MFILFERCNKIVSRTAQRSFLAGIKSNSIWCIFVIEPTFEFGFKNPNRYVRQVCIEILKESMERIDPKIMKTVLTKCHTYINTSASDSCDVVRATTKKIIKFLEKTHNTLYLHFFLTENFSPSNNDAKLVSILAKDVETVKKNSLGKARRVKIER